MGGDHKCPVCQATFTRPQHVARHMRSHTGDRPYKCQHCGDQFARSDLLSRHVNKCHANEKPPPTANTNRRKGSASASRATTSKQACDQCVQSSLPCDGSNPCAKCVQRKCRCTYVKFHRQTAPTGPGHHPRPSSSSARLPVIPHADEFVLGPPPISVPSMSQAENYYSHPFNFPQTYGNASEPSLPLSMDNAGSDFATKYRAQAELLRRAGVNMPPPPATGAGVILGLYTDPQWLNWQHGTSGNFVGQNSMSPSNPSAMASRYLPTDDSKNPPVDKDLQAAMSRHFIESGGDPSQSYQIGVAGGDSYPGGGGASFQNNRPRRSSVDFGSDGSRSIPSSAASSSVHLPMGDMSSVQQQQQQMPYHDTSRGQSGQGAGNYSGMGQLPQDSQMQHSGSQQHGQEGGFSSAFGLMSLDDPNVLAGLSTDGAPFFSNAALNMPPGDPNTTPMPSKHHGSRNGSTGFPTSTPTPGSSREAETRELREFWKAYMRTPLSGPGPSALEAATQAGVSGASRRPGSPTGPRRARVASLPSVKTPTGDSDQQPNYPVGANHNGVGGTSSIRTTLHGNADDLRSYEAAVLARKAPTTLNLVPKKSRTGINASASASPQVPSSRIAASVGGMHDFSRPSSSASTSSLANAFGEGASGIKAGSMTHFRVPSRESSVSTTGDEADGDQLRPSFKRLPSQTLGPANAKRALLSNQEEDDGGEGLPNSLPVGGTNGVSISKSRTGFGGMNPPPHPHRQMVNIADRHRRMSAPSTTSPTTATFPAGAGAPAMTTPTTNRDTAGPFSILTRCD